MEFLFFKTAVWQLIRQMDWIALFILAGLCCLSVFCVAIVVFKFVAFRQHKRQLTLLAQRLRYVKSFGEVVSASKEFQGNLGAEFLTSGMQELRKLLNENLKDKETGRSSKQPQSAASLTTENIEELEFALNKIIEDLLLEEEAFLPVLGTSASVAPFIGLLGTIWGLIHAFIDISQEKSADIAVIAPGMAEALITTLAGLVVAIPALVFYHYFSNELRKFESKLQHISDIFLYAAKRTFLK